jgi:hypothetical protein
MLAAMIVMCLVGVLLAGLGLGVFLTQGSQIRVTAKVLSEKCHPSTDLADGQTETRCDADVQFTTASGQLITTSVTDAFPYEFSGEGQSRTIDLRYDSGDPAQPFKQSNYMSAGEFVLLLIIGVAAMLFGGWGLRRVRRMAGTGRAHSGLAVTANTSEPRSGRPFP